MSALMIELFPRSTEKKIKINHNHNNLKSWASWYDGVSVLPDVHVAFYDIVVSYLMDASGLHA